jgi:hypothetical protein
MRPYRNLNDNSSVLAFEIGSDSIKVMFSHGIYTYSYDSTGQENIERMKTLALNGKGLNTFIDEYIKKDMMLSLTLIL